MGLIRTRSGVLGTTTIHTNSYVGHRRWLPLNSPEPWRREGDRQKGQFPTEFSVPVTPKAMQSMTERSLLFVRTYGCAAANDTALVYTIIPTYTRNYFTKDSLAGPHHNAKDPGPSRRFPHWQPCTVCVLRRSGQSMQLLLARERT
ncbi:hypothetical protein NicSoilC5_02780 [Arthrobacter sp. NicSoilC5]|nr:hypothetical protein NicSoilC5_02780 [Arthrobacter sp. NicSoilC5]